MIDEAEIDVLGVRASKRKIRVEGYCLEELQ
jgi:hypothetical protein